MTTKHLFTTRDVAKQRDCHPATVARVAKAEQIGTRIGRDWLFSPAEFAEICEKIHDSPGNPTFLGKKGKS